MTTTIIVPCYNEGGRLPGNAFRTFAEQSAHAGFLFMDHGSTDGTVAMIAPLVSERPERFQLFRLEANTVKGEAVRRGILWALEGGPDIVGFWDADLSTPLNQLPLFLHVLT